MENTLLFEAKKMNWGQILSESGSWLSTKWNVYRDGTVIKEDTTDGIRNYATGIVTPKSSSYSQYQMDAANFAQLCELLSGEFQQCTAGRGCDGTGWKMTTYNADGTENHSISGYIHGVEVLEAICAIFDPPVRFAPFVYSQPPISPAFPATMNAALSVQRKKQTNFTKAHLVFMICGILLAVGSVLLSLIPSVEHISFNGWGGGSSIRYIGFYTDIFVWTGLVEIALLPWKNRILRALAIPVSLVKIALPFITMDVLNKIGDQIMDVSFHYTICSPIPYLMVALSALQLILMVVMCIVVHPEKKQQQVGFKIPNT